MLNNGLQDYLTNDKVNNISFISFPLYIYNNLLILRFYTSTIVYSCINERLLVQTCKRTLIYFCVL